MHFTDYLRVAVFLRTTALAMWPLYEYYTVFLRKLSYDVTTLLWHMWSNINWNFILWYRTVIRVKDLEEEYWPRGKVTRSQESSTCSQKCGGQHGCSSKYQSGVRQKYPRCKEGSGLSVGEQGKSKIIFTFKDPLGISRENRIGRKWEHLAVM